MKNITFFSTLASKFGIELNNAIKVETIKHHTIEETEKFEINYHESMYCNGVQSSQYIGIDNN